MIWLLICTTFILNIQKSYAAVEIHLDGYFDDWADKPQTYLSYPWQHEGQIHTVKWHVDADNLYLFIKMGTRGGQALNYYIIFYYVDKGGKRQLALSPDQPQKGRISIFDLRNYSLLSSDGYVVRGSNNDGKTSDQAEFRIPLSVFRKEANNQMFNLRLQFPDLGDQSIVFEAGSTAPYMAVILSLLMVLLGLWIYKIKKRERL